MELHISTDDATYATSVYEFAEDNLDTVDGYVSLCGFDRNGNLQHIVNVNRSYVGNQFPKRLTFGQMLDMMKQAGRTKIYFQREDWRNTHRMVALNNQDIKSLFIDEYYENTNLDKDSKPLGVRSNGVPFNKRPYIPSYADMFTHSWIVYDDKAGDNDEKESVDNSTL